MIEENKINRLKLLYFIALEMNRTHTMKELMEIILERCLELTGADTGSVMLINKEESVLDILAFKGLDEKVVNKTKLKIGQGITGWVAQTGEPKLVNNALNEPQYIRIREGLLSEIAVPIKTEDEVIGVISIDSSKENAFTQDDIELLTMVAELAAQIIKKDIISDRLKSKVDAQQVLIETIDLIEKEDDINNIFNTLMDILKEKINILRGMLVFVDLKNPSNLFIKCGYKISDDAIKNGKYKIGEGIIGSVALKGQTIAIKDINKEPRFLNRLKIKRGNEKISFIAAPIKVENNIIGVLAIEKKFENEESFEDSVNTISLLASLIANKVRNYQKMESETKRLLEENIELRKELKEQYSFKNIVGKNENFRKILEQVNMISNTTASVLILGETGTGKELIAKIIHFLSDRREKPFISINCAAIPENLLESELFGYSKGAFTGAMQNKKGKFELADGGTLFLDEIGEMPVSLQPKLLRAIQEKEIQPIGSEKNIKVDIRIIAATNKDLEKLVEEGKFRSDLYFRLNVVTLKLPPLRERKDDIPLLSDFFIKKFNEQYNKNIIGISEEVEKLFNQYDWPGNIRELENIIERAVILAKGNIIDLSLLPDNIKNSEKILKNKFDIRDFIIKKIETLKSQEKIYQNVIGDFEKILIEEILIKTNYNKSKAAKILGMNRNTLKTKMKEYGLN